MNEILELAVAIARDIGSLQRERFSEPREIETKTSSIDLVTDVDRASDRLAVDRISAERPEDSILAEETGSHHRNDAEYRWIIDPLDGTTNYAHGFPHFCVSIGVERSGERFAGAIYDPMREEMFTATRGGGAFLNGKAIRVSKTAQLDRALLATGFGYDVHRAEDDNLENFRRFVKRAQGLRRAGSAALDLAYVACGRFDGFWELSLHPWDVSAGLLIIEEAGGRISNLEGGAVPASGDRCLATNGHLHEGMLQVLAGDA